jgi:pilus assembly protein CpaF
MHLIIKDGATEISSMEIGNHDGVLTIGRHSDCDIQLQGNSGISRHHAQLHVLDGTVCIEDTNSIKGVFVNGQKIEAPTVVEQGSVIKICQYKLLLMGDEAKSSGKSVNEKELKQQTTSFEGEKEEYWRSMQANSDACSGGDLKSVDKENVIAKQHDDDFMKEFENASILYEDATMQLSKKIHEDILDKLNLSEGALKIMKSSEVESKVKSCLDRTLDERRHEIPIQLPINLLHQALLDELIGYGPISPLLRSPKISEIMINGPLKVFVECRGKLHRTSVKFYNEQHLISIIQRIVEPLGRHIDEASPMVDARLPDGSRVNAIIPPLAVNGASMTIRKFADKKLSTDDLIGFGSMTREMAMFLEAAVLNRMNILVSGGTGSGKTTLLNVLSQFIPEDERVITVEDSAELKLAHENLVCLEARPANIEGKGRVSIRDLVINTLRMRPDRIIVGECRGPEALDMLQAMNTGHDGSLTTCHANSPRDAVTRLENMVMMAGYELPSDAIREQISSALNLIVQQTRMSDGSRKIEKITEVTGREGKQILMQDIFTFEQTGFDGEGRVTGYHTATGNIPVFVEELRKRGKLKLDMAVFVPKI